MKPYDQYTPVELIEKIGELERKIAELEAQKKDASGDRSFLTRLDVMNVSLDTIALIDRNGVFTEVAMNKSMELPFGRNDMIGKKIVEVVSPALFESFEAAVKKTFRTGTVSVRNYETERGGRHIYFKCIFSPFDQDHILCQYKDSTEKMQLVRQLERIYVKAQQAEKLAYIGFWSYNTTNRTFSYSGYANQTSDNYETFQFLLEDLYKIVAQENHADIDAFLQHPPKELPKKSREIRCFLMGRNAYIKANIISIREEDNGTTIEGYLQNITPIIHRRKQLEMTTTAVNNSTELIFAARKDGTLFFGNKKFRKHNLLAEHEEIDRFKAYELQGTKLDKEYWSQLVQKLGKDEKVDFRLTDSGLLPGGIRTFNCSSYSICDIQGEEIVWISAQDITDSIQYEARITELNQIMDTVLENIPISIFVKDTGDDFRYIYRNRRSNDIVTPALENSIGKTDFDLFPHEVAQKYRNEDLTVLRTGRTLRVIDEDIHLRTDEKIIFQIKLLAPNGNKAPLLIGIGWDITEQQKLERELITAKEKAEESDRLKSAFLANMSHEIRTPLNAIVGFSRIIAETDNASEREEYYDIVENNNNRLLGLINEILDLSRIEAGVMKFTKSDVSLASLCDDVYKAHILQTPDGVELICDQPKNDLWIITDKNKLIQVFSNLIGNAIKFTRKGEIRFGYERRGDLVLFHVKDTGTGIPQDKVKGIFGRFVKVDTFSQGTGLGLSISKSIVEKLGGAISVSSRVGEGTEFTFTLPYIPASTPGAEEKRERPAGPRKAQKEGKPVILVVEDMKSNFMLLQTLLKNKYTLLHAIDGEEGLKMFRQHNPDLIMMDLKLPKIGGKDATRMIRQMSPDVPVIILTASVNEDEKKEALAAGCNDFLTKPVTPQLLNQTLEKYL